MEIEEGGKNILAGKTGLSEVSRRSDWRNEVEGIKNSRMTGKKKKDLDEMDTVDSNSTDWVIV